MINVGNEVKRTNSHKELVDVLGSLGAGLHVQATVLLRISSALLCQELS